MKGYTLIELLVVIALMVMILIGGTGILFQNLKASSIGNAEVDIGSEMRSVFSMLERDIRFSTITAVGNSSRTECLNAGDVGIAGNTLTAIDLQGLETVYSSDSGRMASVSSATARSVFLTSSSVNLTLLEFTWYCRSGVSDKIKIDVGMSSTSLGTGYNLSRSDSREINLLNSGIY